MEKRINWNEAVDFKRCFPEYKCDKLWVNYYSDRPTDKWKDKIDDRVYKAMYNWEVEITD